MADGAITLDSLLDAIDKKEPFPMVKRPGLGQKGKTISITTNLFRVGCSKLTRKVFQYDVRFTTEDKPREDLFALKKHRELRVQIYKAFIEGSWQSAFGETVIPAWDGNKQLLTTSKLEFGTDENGEELHEKVFDVEVRTANSQGEEGGLKRTRRAVSYKVAIKLAKELPSDMLTGLLQGNFNSVRDPREIMQALDIIMSYRLPPRYLVHGRNFYDPVGAKPAGGGSQILSGFFQSLRPATERLYMNFDITAGLFVQSVSVIELLQQLLSVRRVEEIGTFQSEGIRRALRPFLLNTTHRQRGAFKAKAVTPEFAQDLMFEFDGARITVADYFEREKGIKLKHPQLQCIKLEHSRGGEIFREYLPLELCEIVGGRRWAGKTTQSHVDQIRKMIASKPPERSNKIIDSVKRTADFTRESGGIINDHKKSVLAHFGLALADQAALLDARLLDVPMIEFKDRFNDNQRSIKPQSGAWNVRDARLLEGREVRKWGIFIFATRFNERDAEKFGQAMARSYQQKTGACMTGHPEILARRGTGSIKEMFDKMTDRLGSKIDVIFCVIDEKDSMTYHEVKRLSELEFAYVTQCVKDNRARECKPAVLENIILKLNAKLGCRNCDITAVHKTLINTPTLVLGGDISHGGAGSNSPSVCALVGTTDRYMQQLSASLSVQELQGGSGEAAGRLVRQEEIVDMKRMVKERVDEFVKGCKRAPKAIMYYRDGVADSQFESVITKELVEIREAIRDLKKDHPDWWPGDIQDPVKITAIIHQKRHHVRFFPGKGCPTDRSGNCAPGTVVDTKVGHPYGYDFFLLSHAGIQGCSRPSYYRVILDENQYGPDWLQEVTFFMCHLYASCTRSISGVPVCFYADRLALRVRDYLYESANSDAGSSTYGNVNGHGGRGDDERGREGRYKVAPLHRNLKDKMFFA